MQISVVIPAHNEAAFIGRCLASINEQVLPAGVVVEIIVVLNRCTDATAEVASAQGARLVTNDAKNLSAIRNTGVEAATSDWVVTLDADSWMSPGVLTAIHQHAQSANCAGGGIRIKPERWSLGIAVGYAMMQIPAFVLRLSFGLYWFRKADFEAIGGFDVKRHIAEDVDFQRRLTTHCRQSGREIRILTEAYITTSCRKFDEFGDWHFVRLFWNPFRVRRAIDGQDRAYLDKNWYDVKR